VPLDDALLLAHALATAVMAGVIWTVQLVVYPGFGQAGPTAAWQAVHEAHTRRTGRLVALPWAAQGATLAALLVRRPEGAPPALLAAAAVLAGVPVVVTVLVSVPLHGRLARGWDADAWGRLVRTNWLRTAAWTAGAACAAALLVV
jgi:hypothetical protein